MRDELRAFVTDDGNYACADIDFDDKKWHLKLGIDGKKAGWYFFETTTPYGVLKELEAPPTHYWNKAGERKKVGNYDLGARARRYSPSLEELFSGERVYSGIRKDLRERARDHVFGHIGTGCLALSNYSVLREHSWKFWYACIDDFGPECSQVDLVLNIGEQIWRAHYGWPVLCVS